MERKTARALDRWLTDDAQDYGPADAPDPTPTVRPLLNTLHRVASELDGDPNRAKLSEIVAHTIDNAAIGAAHQNELATRRAALADRLMTIDRTVLQAFEYLAFKLWEDRTAKTSATDRAARLAELLIDLTDGAL